ncbi:MAG: nitrous oxide-stimulated promoter family protein [Candidatus Bathyarchaeum sp.]|nr:MAG: nitrous oxide-stimulated promoter family protein [Candidatus Bathyarchaeum sp.]
MRCSDGGFSESDQPAIIKREKKMVEAMVQIYCESHHSTRKSLCSKCVDLKDYAKNRLENCRYQEKKPVCGRCGLKCYNNKFRDYAETVFMYSGPRMFFQHPILGLRHICDSFRNNDQLKKS